MAGAAVARGQTPEEVLDRNLAELLQEMRVAITGVQILFAFLLTLPRRSGEPLVSAPLALAPEPISRSTTVAAARG